MAEEKSSKAIAVDALKHGADLATHYLALALEKSHGAASEVVEGAAKAFAVKETAEALAGAMRAAHRGDWKEYEKEITSAMLTAANANLDGVPGACVALGDAGAALARAEGAPDYSPMTLLADGFDIISTHISDFAFGITDPDSVADVRVNPDGPEPSETSDGPEGREKEGSGASTHGLETLPPDFLKEAAAPSIDVGATGESETGEPGHSEKHSHPHHAKHAHETRDIADKNTVFEPTIITIPAGPDTVFDPEIVTKDDADPALMPVDDANVPSQTPLNVQGNDAPSLDINIPPPSGDNFRDQLLDGAGTYNADDLLGLGASPGEPEYTPNFQETFGGTKDHVGHIHFGPDGLPLQDGHGQNLHFDANGIPLDGGNSYFAHPGDGAGGDNLSPPVEDTFLDPPGTTNGLPVPDGDTNGSPDNTLPHAIDAVHDMPGGPGPQNDVPNAADL